MIKMIVFDMAGTTVNEDNVVYKTLRNSINDAGYSLTLDQVLAEGAGKEKYQAIKDILKVYGGTQDETLAKKIFARFLISLEKAYKELEISPVAGAEELFKELKKRNILVILNTGYNEETARSLTKKLGWQEGAGIDGLITASDVKQNRPKPDMILLAMSRFNVTNPSQVVKVGDSIIDIEEGRNAGCGLNIGITTGAHTEAQLLTAHPDYILHNLLELLPVLDKQG